VYFDKRLVETEVASSANPIFYLSADSKLVLNKLGTIGKDEISEYHRLSSEL
jgi:hypothetical protein